MMARESWVVLVGAFLAVACQLIIAPNIVIFSAVPNFILVFVLIIAIVRPTNSVLVLAFVLGLLFDLIGQGPLGVMAFLLVLTAFLASRAFVLFNNDTFFTPFIILTISILVVEVFYTAFLLGFGLNVSLFDALLYRTLPSFIINCVMGLIFYFLIKKLMVSPFVNAGSDSLSPHSVPKKKRYR